MEQVVKPKKYIRTQMKLDSGEIIDARICVATGEIKPHKYPVVKPMTKAKALPKGETNGVVSDEPSWMRIPAPNADSRVTAKRVTRLSKSNPNNVYLEGYMFLKDAVEDYPIIDDLFVGATSLGNSGRDPVNKGILFSMLRDLDDINVTTVQGYTGYNEGHCYKLAQSLRIISTALDNEID